MPPNNSIILRLSGGPANTPVIIYSNIVHIKSATCPAFAVVRLTFGESLCLFYINNFPGARLPEVAFRKGFEGIKAIINRK